MIYYLDGYTHIDKEAYGGVIVENKATGISILLDESGTLFIQSIRYSPSRFSEILQRVMSEYSDADKQEISSDLQEFIDELVKLGLVRSIDSTLSKLQINLTERCNERCVHCYIPKESRVAGESLDLNLVLDTIQRFVSLGGKELVLSGGEVLMCRDLPAIIEYATKSGLEISLLSNLTILSEGLFHILVKSGVSVQTSLYSSNPEVHDYITQRKGSCEKTISAIKKLREADVNVVISCTVMKDNKDDFLGVLELGDRLGAITQCSCALNMDLDFNCKNKETRLSEEEASIFFKQLYEYHRANCNMTFSLKKHNIALMKENNIIFALQAPCQDLYNSCSINGNGDVVPCASFGLAYGNIHTKPIDEIWSEVIPKHYISHLTKGDMGECATCEDYEYCFVCPSLKYNQGLGDISKTDPYHCRIAKIARQIDKQYNQD